MYGLDNVDTAQKTYNFLMKKAQKSREIILNSEVDMAV